MSSRAGERRRARPKSYLPIRMILFALHGVEWPIGECVMDESAIRVAIEQRWAKPTSGDLYDEDVILDFPQSGERIRGRANLVAQRSADPDHPSISKVLRIMGSGPVWISEVVITYDGKPWYTVNIHEFRGDKVFRETQYFAEPFAPAAWRSQWIEQVKPD